MTFVLILLSMFSAVAYPHNHDHHPLLPLEEIINDFEFSLHLVTDPFHASRHYQDPYQKSRDHKVVGRGPIFVDNQALLQDNNLILAMTENELGQWFKQKASLTEKSIHNLSKASPFNAYLQNSAHTVYELLSFTDATNGEKQPINALMENGRLTALFVKIDGKIMAVTHKDTGRWVPVTPEMLAHWGLQEYVHHIQYIKKYATTSGFFKRFLLRCRYFPETLGIGLLAGVVTYGLLTHTDDVFVKTKPNDTKKRQRRRNVLYTTLACAIGTASVLAFQEFLHNDTMRS